MNHQDAAVLVLVVVYFLFLVSYPLEMALMTVVILLFVGAFAVIACMRSSQISQDEEERE